MGLDSAQLGTHRDLDVHVRGKQLVREVRDGLDVERNTRLALRQMGERGGGGDKKENISLEGVRGTMRGRSRDARRDDGRSWNASVAAVCGGDGDHGGDPRRAHCECVITNPRQYSCRAAAFSPYLLPLSRHSPPLLPPLPTCLPSHPQAHTQPTHRPMVHQLSSHAPRHPNPNPNANLTAPYTTPYRATRPGPAPAPR